MLDVGLRAAPAHAAPTGAPCPVCGSTREEGRFQARDPHYGNPGQWWERRCADCGSFSLDPMPSQSELLAMYPPDTYYAFRLPPRRPVRDRIRRWLGFTVSPREPTFPSPGRMLDFGCGAGESLLRMRQAGWECAGVEVSEAALQAARGAGLAVETRLAAYPDAHFDYVRANHALEHVTDPRAVLEDMRRVLKPGGTLFVGVPTTESQNARWFGPYWWYLGAPVHPVSFSTRGLVGLLREVGFEVVQVSTNSDFGSLAGSLQIYLNRRSRRRSSEGVIFAIRPLLLVGHWLAKLQDRLGVGDKLEVIARRPAA